MKKLKIVILGITGSIGDSTCSIVRSNSERFEIVLASAHSNREKLLQLQSEFNIPKTVLTGVITKQENLGTQATLYYGEENLINLLKDVDYNIVLNAISGSAGLFSSYTVLTRGKKLALANKESLVMAGHLMSDISSPGQIIPVDSEHSAIFQCLGNHKGNEVGKLILTASGGSFRDRPLNTFKEITVEDTLKHPTWDMGAKVTIDSASMMNKGLEVIEAHWLFDMPYDKIEAIIHPQSIIHSLVRFKDGSHIAQLSNPSMQIPILYALTYPEHVECDNVQTDLLSIPQLTFKKVEIDRYPLFFLALEVGEEGGIMPTIMNSANEACIDLFLKRKIGFRHFYKIISETLISSPQIVKPDLETIIAVNKETYNKILTKYI